MDNVAKNFVVGVDVGGQSIKMGIVDTRGEILCQSVIKTNTTSDPQVIVNEMASSIKDLIARSGKEGQIRGVGVGAPNGNYYDGTIAFAPNLPWASNGSVAFADMLSKALGGLKVTLTNDANAAALGEMTYGVARGMKNFIMITLGTGVGSGIIVNGELLYGHDGFAGELGHTCAVRGGRRCGCGRDGCLEAYCSAIGAAKTAVEWLQMTDEPSLLRGLPSITSKDIYDAAKQGDALSLRVFEFTGRILGRSLADFVAFSAPEAIVLFGGLARSREFLEKPILDSLNENVLALWRGKVQILFSSLKESDAAILGASALAW